MLEYIIFNLENSKIFSGIMMILLNIGAKYVSIDINPTQESFLSNVLVRRILIFTIVFTATRDIIVSLFLTLIFLVLIKFFLNEESKFCLLPKKYRIKQNNYKVSDIDIENAKKVLNLVEYQKKNKINVKSKQELMNDIKNKKLKKFKKMIKFMKNNDLFLASANMYNQQYL